MKKVKSFGTTLPKVVKNAKFWKLSSKTYQKHKVLEVKCKY